VVTPGESTAKKQAVIQAAGGRLSRRMKGISQLLPERLVIPVRQGIAWDSALDEKLGEQIADVVGLFDADFVRDYEQHGDEITIKGKGRKRSQAMEFSGRNALRVFSYLDHFQMRDPHTGRVDVAQTLRNAFQRYYLDRLASDTKRERLKNTLDDMLTAGVTDDTLKINFEGKLRSRKQIFDLLVERISGSQTTESLSDEERARILAQAEFDFADTRDALLNNPLIPEEIRNQMRKNLE